MINILIVDDNKEKLHNILSFLKSIKYLSTDNIDVASDIVSSKKHLSENCYDVAIIDLNLPTRFGEDPKPFNGITLIDEIKHNKSIIKPTYILALTEYSDLIDEYSSKFYNEMTFLLHYIDNEDGWKKQILSHIEYVHETKLRPEPVVNFDYDIGIITALHDPEFYYLLKLDANWQKRKHSNDSTIYYEGVFSSETKKLRVVAAASPQMGMPASTTLSLKVIEHYRPRYLAMVGIAAGVKSKCELGDILIADISWDYGNGKIKRKGGGVTFEPDPKSLTISPDLKEKFLTIVRDRSFLDKIKEDWTGSDIVPPLNIHIGPVASGAAVLEDPELIREIISHNRKLIGIEMEIYGLFYAAINCTEPRPYPIAIKSVCDFGDAKKNNMYQKYSSFVSSRFLYDFAIAEL